MRKPEKRLPSLADKAPMGQAEYLDRLDRCYRWWLERATGMERKQKMQIWMKACVINVSEMANSDIARELKVMIDKHSLYQKMLSGKVLYDHVAAVVKP